MKTAMELEKIFRLHAGRYPHMQVQDAVKLVYQNEFGGGHLIVDPSNSLKRLKEEISSLAAAPVPRLSEALGNGLVRVNLAALEENGLSPESLNGLFVSSSHLVCGSLESFKEKLDMLCAFQKETGLFGFTCDELNTYLREYEEKGFPVVSHTQIYRDCYAPAYRVVLSALLDGESSRTKE